MKRKAKSCKNCAALESEISSMMRRAGAEIGRLAGACNRLAKERDDLRIDADADELMLARQRERLIRLTEIKNWVSALTGLLSASWNQHKFVASELDGTVWIKAHNMTSVNFATRYVEGLLAALETDTALPPKEKAK